MRKKSDLDGTGTFASHWQQWFKEKWFDTLRDYCVSMNMVSNDYLGVMSVTGDKEFEYWIGAFYAPTLPVPDSFEATEIPTGDIGVCWLYGNEKSGELYSMEASDLTMAALKEKGWNFSEEGWFFERFNTPRFTVPDEKGNVILDICVFLI